MEKKMQDSWRERLRDLYLVENDDITSPNSIDFNWGSFLFKRKTSKPTHFYLTTRDGLEDFVASEISKAREEGRKAERDRIFRGLDSIDCIKEALPKNYSALGMQFGIYRAKEIVLEKELSKLTTK